jgi:hypothetical protein
LNRREFCVSGAVAAGLATTTGCLAALVSAPRTVDTVIFDTRFDASRHFAAAWAAPAARRGIAGDVTRLWFDEIGPQWSRGGGAIAGMTTPAALFCLEQLAKDHWRRVVMRREHPSDGLVSWIIA